MYVYIYIYIMYYLTYIYIYIWLSGLLDVPLPSPSMSMFVDILKVSAIGLWNRHSFLYLLAPKPFPNSGIRGAWLKPVKRWARFGWVSVSQTSVSYHTYIMRCPHTSCNALHDSNGHHRIMTFIHSPTQLDVVASHITIIPCYNVASYRMAANASVSWWVSVYIIYWHYYTMVCSMN